MDWQLGNGLAIDWRWIGKLAMDWQWICRIGLGLAEMHKGSLLQWHLIEHGLSESSSVETLRSVPYSTCSIKSMGDQTRIGLELA